MRPKFWEANWILDASRKWVPLKIIKNNIFVKNHLHMFMVS